MLKMQPYSLWYGSYLEYLREWVKIINFNLQYYSVFFLSEEQINNLKKERERLLAKIYELEWNEIKLRILNNSKSLWQTSINPFPKENLGKF